MRKIRALTFNISLLLLTDLISVTWRMIFTSLYRPWLPSHRHHNFPHCCPSSLLSFLSECLTFSFQNCFDFPFFCLLYPPWRAHFVPRTLLKDLAALLSLSWCHSALAAEPSKTNPLFLLIRRATYALPSPLFSLFGGKISPALTPCGDTGKTMKPSGPCGIATEVSTFLLTPRNHGVSRD